VVAFVHDFFDVIGLSSDAPVSEVRRARRARRLHPDFRTTVDLGTVSPGVAHDAERAALRDVAVDFVDVAALIDRIEADFFAGG
jgi:hypothetical protein